MVNTFISLIKNGLIYIYKINPIDAIIKMNNVGNIAPKVGIIPITKPRINSE